MIKVGVVGLGVMGQHHARVYAELDCELVGVVDPDEGRATQVARQYNTHAYSTHKELISRIDAVSIAVPTSLHKEITIDFLGHGVHCLVEKPIASNLEDAREMIREADRNRAKLMVGHIERFNPAVQKLKRTIDQGILGKLMIVSFRRVGPFVPRIRDVGIIIDSATHDIDVARYLVGNEVIGVFSKTGRFKHATKEDHAIILLDFGDTTGCIEANWFTPHKERTLVATGSEAIAHLDYIKQELRVSDGCETVTTRIDGREPLRSELEHFLECIRNDSIPLVTGTEGLRVLEIALEAASDYVGEHWQGEEQPDDKTERLPALAWRQ